MIPSLHAVPTKPEKATKQQPDQGRNQKSDRGREQANTPKPDKPKSKPN